VSGSWQAERRSRRTRRHPRDDPRAEVGEDVRVGVGVRIRVGPVEFQLYWYLRNRPGADTSSTSTKQTHSYVCIAETNCVIKMYIIRFLPTVLTENVCMQTPSVHSHLSNRLTYMYELKSVCTGHDPSSSAIES